MDDPPPTRSSERAARDAAPVGGRATPARDRREGRPPLDDFLGYLDGTLAGDRRATFEQYLARNREARRRLKSLARLEEKLQEGLVIDSILSDARARTRQAAETEPRPDEAGSASDAFRFDETLVAAWIDGALTREERAELHRRLADPAVAVEFYRQAQTARRATDRKRRDEIPDAPAAAVDDVPVDEAETTEMPAPRVRRDSTLNLMGVATESSTDDASAGNWLGRLLIHSSPDSVWVLDASPTGGDRPAVEELETAGHYAIHLPFERVNLDVMISPAYRGVALSVTASGEKLPAQFVVTDEAGRRLHRTDGSTGEPNELPPLRPGVYRLMAPPLPLNVLVCVNGELGTTEIHQLRGPLR